MTDPAPLTPDQQTELDALCDALQNAPRCKLSDVADCLAKAQIVPRDPACANCWSSISRESWAMA